MSTETVPKGYKRTEVGVIPEEWNALALKEIGKPVRGGSPRPAGDSRFFNGTFIPWLTVAALTNISDSQIVVTDTATCLTEEGSLRSRELGSGTLIIANSGATLGVAKKLGIKCCANDGIAALLSLRSDASVDYLIYYINSKTKYLREVVATGNGQPNLNTELIGVFQVPYPPTLAEQQAIAAALSDADALIESLEQLIAKKRQIKQGAMQELLTGKRRLPGFTGKWEKQSLSSVVVNLEAGVSVNFVEHPNPFSTGDQCILKTSAISGGKFYPNECKLIIANDVVRARVNPQKDTILISRMNTPDLVGEVGYIEFDQPTLFLPDRLWMMTFDSNKGVVPRWLSFVLSSAQMQEQIKNLCTGTSGSMKNISKSAILSLQVLFPSLPEQTAIASVLSDMDTELEALEGKLDKARQVKQGMMQQLLTGKVRLV